jgi:hypothetical protein
MGKRPDASIIVVTSNEPHATRGSLLGHSAASFTLQVYGHLMEETKREVSTKMDAALNPVATNPLQRRVQ